MLRPYIPQNAHLKQSKLRQIFEKAPADTINLGLGQPGEDTPAFIREAAARVVRDKPLGYTLNAGLLPLREKIAGEFSKSGVHADQICITAGVQEALYSLFYTLLDEQAEILLPDPGFLTYPALANLCRTIPVTYALKAEQNFRFDADSVIKNITPKTSAILLGHPSNPTGSNASEDELRKLVTHCANREEGPIWIISDEVYHGMHYSDCSSMAGFLDEYPYIVILRGASKSHHMTGWRLGWAVLPEMISKPFIAAHQYVTTCVSAVSQYTFLEIRGSDDERAWFEHQQVLYRKKRDMVEQMLRPKRELYGGEGAFYWVMKLTEADLSVGNDEEWVMRMMMHHKVTTTPGSAFGHETDGFVRISYGPKIDALETGLLRLAAQLE